MPKLCRRLQALDAVRMSRDGVNFSTQEIVDRIVALQPSRADDQLDQLFRTGTGSNKFDVSQYFTALDALRLQEGYTLDWVYFRPGGIGGRPILYARQTDAPPYANVENYVGLSTDSPCHLTEKRLVQNEAFFFGYLGKIQVEESVRGFFQFVVLRLLGDRFHLCWHELYNDIAMVCSKRGWHILLEEGEGKRFEHLASGFKTAAEELDFLPFVRMGHTEVKVGVFTFCQFGGIDLHHFAISRQFPHKILGYDRETVVHHSAPFLF
jgi:hypothetical protein